MKNGRFLLVAGMLTLSAGMMAQTEGELLNLLPDGVEANINPERKQDKAKNLVVAGSPEKGYKAFFAATNATHGEELWVTDGTPEGTHMVKDIVPGTAGSNPSHLGRLNDKVLFSAYTDETGQELWVSDGTEEGTFLLADTYIVGDGNPKAFTQMDETRAIFAATDDESAEYDPDRGPQQWLWITDGTIDGTHRVKAVDVRWPGQDNTTLHTAYVRVGRRVFFKADNVEGTTGEELWVTDGTEEGTHLVMDINWERYGEGQPGYEEGWTRNSAIDELKNYKNEKVFFRAWTPDFGQEPWASDGLDVDAVNGPGGEGTEHTYLICDTRTDKDENGIGRGGEVFGAGFEVYKDRFWFRAWREDGGFEFGGTNLQKGDFKYFDIWDEEPSIDHNSYSDPGCVFDGVYMFCAAHGFDEAREDNYGGELWYTDGETVKMQMDLVPGTGCDWVKEQTVAGGSLYWWNEVEAVPLGAYTGALYRLDSKESTPVVVTHLDPAGDFCHSLRNMGGQLVFTSDATKKVYVYKYTKSGWDGVTDMGYLEPDFLTEAEKTAIRSIESDRKTDNGVYTLGGVKVRENGDTRKLQKGVYIVGDKKIVIK